MKNNSCTVKRRSLGIHDGLFHADEVTAAALLIAFDLVDEDKIIRTRDPVKLAQAEYICDVGGVYDPAKKLFDHHQADYRGELSSAGMVLLYLKESGVLKEEEYTHFNQLLVKGVDDHDNGRSQQEMGVTTFSHVIANFNPIAYDVAQAEIDLCFNQALLFAIGHIKRLRERFLYNIACREIVKEAMIRNHYCLFFDKSLPWQESFFAQGGKEHPALFVIMPAYEHWKLRAIPPDALHRMDVRMPLPKEWAGLLEEDLKRVTGISGAIFCHKGRFTSVWATKEDALLALKMIFQKEKIPYENSV